MSKGPRCHFSPFPALAATPVAGKTTDDYRIYASYRADMGKIFYGALKVQRLTDKRVLYPFDGCPIIGPFNDPTSAKQAALALGEKLVNADLKSPEM